MTNNNWISVEERLPKTREPILAYFKDGCIDVSMLYFSNSFMGQLFHGEVTHWQPLPKAPGEVADETSADETLADEPERKLPPCQIGDIIYVVYDFEDEGPCYDEFSVMAVGSAYLWCSSYQYSNPDSWDRFSFDKMGIDFFLKESEAQAWVDQRRAAECNNT